MPVAPKNHQRPDEREGTDFACLLESMKTSEFQPRFLLFTLKVAALLTEWREGLLFPPEQSLLNM